MLYCLALRRFVFLLPPTCCSSMPPTRVHPAIKAKPASGRKPASCVQRGAKKQRFVFLSCLPPVLTVPPHSRCSVDSPCEPCETHQEQPCLVQAAPNLPSFPPSHLSRVTTSESPLSTLRHQIDRLESLTINIVQQREEGSRTPSLSSVARGGRIRAFLGSASTFWKISSPALLL